MIPLHGYLGLGSNLGDRAGHLERARAELTALPGLKLLAASSIYSSPAQGYESQHEFLNQVLEVEWQGRAKELLAACLNIQGRSQHAPDGEAHVYSDRELDIDLLSFDGVDVCTAELHLPHPRLTERAFVLLPLAELAPELHCKGQGIGHWLAALPAELRNTTHIIKSEQNRQRRGQQVRRMK